MKTEALLTLLEDAVEKLQIKLDYDDLRKDVVNTHGGLFTLHGERHALVHNDLSAREKAEVILEILSKIDTEGVHLPPEVRKRLDAYKKLDG
ncbi:MAG: hypothetical protein HY880_03030 [Deltaproteobacteria bacterium]|nr:hypothetical protein [Deltaproteobacteria bacterium]